MKEAGEPSVFNEVGNRNSLRSNRNGRGLRKEMDLIGSP